MKRKRTMGGRKKRRVHRKRQMCASKFTDFFTKTIPKAAKTVYQKVLKPVGGVIKKTGLVSTGLSMIPHPAGKIAGTIAKAAGWGRRRKVGAGRRVRRKRQQGGLSDLTGRLFLI